MCSEAPPELWPLRPRPYPEEAFSGWLARISQAHGLPPGRFARELRRHVRARAQDLDTQPSYELMAEVSRRTGVRYRRIREMSLRGHVELYFARNAMAQQPEDAFGFCVLCWRADADPYIRRAWRLPWTACALDRVPLQWRCSACDWVCCWSRLGANGPLSICGGCGADLRYIAPPVWAKGQAKQIDEHLAWQAAQFRRGEEAVCGVG
jgi:hypothetical protein